MAPGTVVCMNCGHDTRKGIQTSTLVQKTRQRSGKYRLTCSQCGYDLTGAAGLTCPKCGTHVDIASPDRLNEKIRRSTTRDAYRKPILMILIGLGSIVLFHAMTNQSDELLEYFIGYAVSVPFGIIAFFVCCMMWLGFDAPWHLTTLNLAAVYAITDLVGAVTGLLPIGIIAWLITLFVYVGLLSSMLDLDFRDAWFVAVVTFLIKAGIIMLMGMYIFSQS